MAKKEELTTKMHMEFCRDEQERVELAACAVFFDVTKYNKTLESSLKDHGITAEQYEKYRPYQRLER